QALTKHGLDDWVRREWQLSERVGGLDDWYTHNACRQLGFAAAAQGRFLEAADRSQSTMLRCLNNNTGYLESSAYLRVPHRVHQLRARGLLTAGKVDQALAEIQICLSYLPADADTPILLTPLLEQNGRKQDANDLFAKV